MKITSEVIYKSEPTDSAPNTIIKDKWFDLQDRVIKKHIQSGNTINETAKELNINYQTFSNFMRNDKVQYSDKRYDIYKEWLK